jgi:molybdopterin converting factor small subunit
MSTSFYIPGPLLQFTNGQRVVKVDDCYATVREALDSLFSVYPGLRARIFTEQGIVREHINVFVGKEDVRYLDGLGTKLEGSVEISIVPAVSGGAQNRYFRALYSPAMPNV